MQAIVDRIEGDVAVLEIDGKRFLDVPLSQMPAGCAKGDVYEGTPGSWKKDDAAKTARLQANADLMARLFRRPR